MKKSVLKFGTSVMFMLLASLSFVSWSSKNVKDEAIKKSIPMNTRTIEEKTVTSDIYKENDLTLVNIMATWCGPCVKEIPELNEIDAENNGIGVVGVVFDTYNSKTGAEDRKAIFEAQGIKEKTGAKYPFVISNDDIVNATLKNRAAILPMSFIVDKNGNIVEGPIAGAKSKADWLSIINKAKNK